MSKKKITEATLDDLYDHALNEAGYVSVAGYEYQQSQVLKAVDPIAYRTGKHDFADSLIRDGYEIENY